MAGEELFSTDVNSQNTGYDQNNPVAGNIVGNSASTNPLDSDALKLLTTYLSQTNVPQASTTLPPQYYYPGQQGVAIGQMSGPMGSLTTYSPGQALFPMSVLDAVEKENKAMKAKWLEDQLKPWDYKYYHVDQTGLDDEFQRFQNMEWDKFTNEWYEKAGRDWGVARKMAEREGAFKRKASELETIQRNVNDTYKNAIEVITAFETGKGYVNEKAYNAAQNWLELVSKGNFADNYDDIQNARKDFVVAVSMSDASKDIVAGINASVADNPKWNTSIYDNTGKPVATSIDKLIENIRGEGLSSYMGEDGIKELNKKIDASWAASYGQSGAKLEYMPTKEEYRDYITSVVKDSVTKQLEHIKSTNAYDIYRAKQMYKNTVLAPAQSVQKNVVSPNGLITNPNGVNVMVKGAPKAIPFTGMNTSFYDALGNVVSVPDASGYITAENSYLLPDGSRFYYYTVQVETSPGSGVYTTVSAPSNTSLYGVWQGGLDAQGVEFSETPSANVQPQTGVGIGGNVKPDAYQR